MSHTNSPFQKLIQGAMAGWIATLPMTIFMQVAWQRLPERERYPLPPRQITRKVVKELGVRRQLSDQNQTALTLLLHFSYGALAGSVYEMFEERIPLHHS